MFARTLLEANETPTDPSLRGSWHYRLARSGIGWSGAYCTLHLFHFADDGAYRCRVFCYPRPADPDNPEEEVWTFDDGAFQSAAAALDYAEGVATARLAALAE